MKYLRRFNENKTSIYNPEWEKSLPDIIRVIKGYDNEVKTHVHKKGNVMIHSNLVQITYDNDEFGYPDTLEFDIYFSKFDGFKLDIDITWGDEVVSEFSIEPPNKISVIEYTSYHSKFDPSNTVFAFDDDSLLSITKFLNHFEGIDIKVSDLNFLDKYDNYIP
jgi:hypothetical protein